MSEKKERNITIAIKVLNGGSLVSVGNEFGITPERVRQIFGRVCRIAVYRNKNKNEILKKLPKEWFYIREARKYKDLLIDAIQQIEI